MYENVGIKQRQPPERLRQEDHQLKACSDYTLRSTAIPVGLTQCGTKGLCLSLNLIPGIVRQNNKNKTYDDITSCLEGQLLKTYRIALRGVRMVQCLRNYAGSCN